jgi:hypothetical protein
MAIILHPDAATEEKPGQQGHQGSRNQQQQKEQQQQQQHWGQALHYLDHTAATSSGDTLQLAVQRQGPKLTVQLLGGTTANDKSTAPAQTPANSTPSSTTNDSSSSSSSTAATATAGSAVVPLQLQPVARPPWLRPGAGIEDPAVWSVTKCRQLLGQMLQRAPGGKFPPIWNDLELMQVRFNVKFFVLC